MHRQLKLPARFLLVLLGTVLLAAGMTSVSLANEPTNFHDDYFDLVKSTTNTAYFAIDESCRETDENCTVEVRGIAPGDGWLATINACTESRSGNERYKDFEDCWDGHVPNVTVEWPTISPADDFEITPYCQRGDEVCAEELRVCFNANDCDDNRYGRKDWTQKANSGTRPAPACTTTTMMRSGNAWTRRSTIGSTTIWGATTTTTIWKTRGQNRRGFTLDDYENDLDDIGGDRPSTRRSETVSERSQQQGASRTSTPIYQPVGTQGPGFRPTRDAYLTVNFTAYLETDAPYRICNTAIGCITVVTLSNTFRSYMQNLHIVIQDPGVLGCMGRTGWDVGNNHAIPFDNANLIACDARIRTANQVCPAKDTGASGDLFTMWDTGLLRGILFDTEAQSHRLQVERARNRTPECLCTAGFTENNFVVTAGHTAGPWERSRHAQGRRTCATDQTANLTLFCPREVNPQATRVGPPGGRLAQAPDPVLQL